MSQLQLFPESLQLGSHELIVDLFAGGGGTSTGLRAAINREVDIAVNHSPKAITMHAKNHPATKHFCEDVFEVDPISATEGKPVGLLWLSPDCRDFSRAKGGTPVSQGIRGLAWVAVDWIEATSPRIVMMENVPEFEMWGPTCIDENGNEKADPNHRGETFKLFVETIRSKGYTVEYKNLTACDFGAPTSRTRFFLVARRDGVPISWPEPTHCNTGKLKPFRTSGEIIDWSIPMESIFTRKKPLVTATNLRIVRGLYKFVINHLRPYVLAVEDGKIIAANIIRYHGAKSDTEIRAESLHTPLPTITTENRFALSVAELRPATALETEDRRHVVAAYIHKYYGGPNGQQTPGSSLHQPLDTITACDHNSLVAVHMSRQFGQGTGHSLDQPLATITGGRDKSLIVAAWLQRFNGTGIGQDLNEPLGTITTKDRFALVTVVIEGELYVITDIQMRMLHAHELYAAQGFPADYVIDPMYLGKTMTITDQKHLCGNSVPPALSEALARANLTDARAMRAAA